ELASFINHTRRIEASAIQFERYITLQRRIPGAKHSPIGAAADDLAQIEMPPPIAGVLRRHIVLQLAAPRAIETTEFAGDTRDHRELVDQRLVRRTQEVARVVPLEVGAVRGPLRCTQKQIRLHAASLQRVEPTRD